jgi:hypothetical protein
MRGKTEVRKTDKNEEFQAQYEDERLLGCSVVQSLPKFQRCTTPPSSGWRSLMKVTVSISETSVNLYQTTGHHKWNWSKTWKREREEWTRDEKWTQTQKRKKTERNNIRAGISDCNRCLATRSAGSSHATARTGLHQVWSLLVHDCSNEISYGQK